LAARDHQEPSRSGVTLLATVRASSARTPVGLAPTQAALCMRAGKLEPRTCAPRDKRQREVSSARVGGLGIDTYGYERMALLAARTLGDLAGEIGDGEIPIVLAVPAAGRADDDPRFGADLVHALSTKSGVRLDKSDALVVRAGHAGAAYA